MILLDIEGTMVPWAIASQKKVKFHQASYGRIRLLDVKK